MRCAIEKSDLIQQYRDSHFSMQLRTLAQMVYKRGPGDSDGTPMCKMLASIEQGSMGPDVHGVMINDPTMGMKDVC